MENRYFISGKVTVIEAYHKFTKRYFYVLVDTEDIEMISKHVSKLSIAIKYHTNYCLYITKSKQGKSLHRLIMNTPRELIVDHINHNGLDNRKKNLRNTTYKVNRHNRIKGNHNPMHTVNNPYLPIYN